MKKLFVYILAVMIVLSLTLPLVSAHCPLCTGAAVAGVGVARFYGVDDSIVGLFLGAAIISSALWFNKWLKKKIKIPFQEILLVLFSFFMFAIPFYYAGLITNFDMVKSMPEHHSMLGLGILGIDKLLFGMILGSLGVWGAFTLNEYIKKKKGKVLYSYQGVSFMLITLAVLTLIFLIIV